MSLKFKRSSIFPPVELTVRSSPTCDTNVTTCKVNYISLEKVKCSHSGTASVKIKAKTKTLIKNFFEECVLRQVSQQKRHRLLWNCQRPVDFLDVFYFSFDDGQRLHALVKVYTLFIITPRRPSHHRWPIMEAHLTFFLARLRNANKGILGVSVFIRSKNK